MYEKLLLTTAIACLSANAMAADGIFLSDSDRGSRFMLYVEQGFGPRMETPTAPEFGLRLDQRTPDWVTDDTGKVHMQRFMPLVDLRMRMGEKFSVLSNGYKLYDSSTDSSGGDSSGNDSSLGWLNNGWVVGGLLVGATLGISCATDNWPCRSEIKSSGSTYTPPPNTPPTGGATGRSSGQ
jgi:hypothetical protein